MLWFCYVQWCGIQGPKRLNKVTFHKPDSDPQLWLYPDPSRVEYPGPKKRILMPKSNRVSGGMCVGNNLQVNHSCVT